MLLKEVEESEEKEIKKIGRNGTEEIRGKRET